MLDGVRFGRARVEAALAVHADPALVGAQRRGDGWLVERVKGGAGGLGLRARDLVFGCVGGQVVLDLLEVALEVARGLLQAAGMLSLG